MDLRDTPEEAAFRQEVREFIAQNVPDSSKQRGATAVRGLRPRVEPQARRGGLRRPHLAEGVRRRRRAVQPPGDLPRGVARAEAPSHLGVIGLGMAGPTIMAWGTRAEGALPLEDPEAPRRSGARASPSPTPAATSPPSARGSRTTATTSSSTARRCGRRSRTSPTTASSSASACPTSAATRTSPT